MKNTKKGFTLVELLVVIAILAILATVSVISYTSYIKEANKSNDTVIAKELTNLVQAADVLEKIESFDDVIKVLHENGFLIAKLNTKTDGCFFVWDSRTNKILLVDATEDFAVIFPESGYTEKGATWHLACSDIDLIKDFDLGDIQVMRTVSSVESLKEFIAAGEECTVYIDESIAMNSQEQVAVSSGVITLKLADSSMYGNNDDGYAVDNIPFLVNGGTLNIEGGVISATGSWLDADGDPVDSAVLARSGVLNLNNTTVEAAGKEIVVAYAGANGTVSNATITAKSSAINLAGNSNVVIENCTINVDNNAVWVSSSGGYTETLATIKGGTYNAVGNTIAMYGGTIIIEDGNFSAEKTNMFRFWNSGSTLIIKDGTFTTATGSYAFEELTATILRDMLSTNSVGYNVENGIIITPNADGSWTITN